MDGSNITVLILHIYIYICILTKISKYLPYSNWERPPRMADAKPRAILPLPPLIAEYKPEAVFPIPPRTEAPDAFNWLLVPKTTPPD